MAIKWAGASAVILATISAAADAADYGDLQCQMGSRKSAVRTTMCIGTPSNWITCSGFPRPDGDGGLWKDTGVPCGEKPPRSPADFRPVPPPLHPPPSPDAKRIIDRFRGIFFICTPDGYANWTVQACAEITKEWVRQAEAAREPYALVEVADDAAAMRKKGEAAGIPAGSEIQWAVSFKRSENGAVSLHPAMTGVFEVVPGIFTNRSIIIGGDIYMDANRAKPASALEAAKGLFEAHFKYLFEPR